eukprot:SAG31_NODE_9029_length_1345_cov_1.897271_2_plen_81_part_01
MSGQMSLSESLSLDSGDPSAERPSAADWRQARCPTPKELQTRLGLVLLGIACFPMTETITLQTPMFSHCFGYGKTFYAYAV